MTAAQPVHFVRPTAPEDAARADLYALLARLFYAGPDAAVLAAIVGADTLIADVDAPLSRAWREFQAVSRTVDAQQACDEYGSLFVGVGKAPVSIYASHYLSANYKELTLVHLRDELERLGLARKAEATEPEDHLAGLLDVMQHLVRRNENDALTQAAFFNSYLKPWHEAFCSAIEMAPGAPYYAPLSRLMKIYFALEVEVYEWVV